jgi:hypothetical protein
MLKLACNKYFLLISENGKQWTVVANASTETEINTAESNVPNGVHVMRVDRSQLRTIGDEG